MAKHYVVIDTNVIVSALYDENEDSKLVTGNIKHFPKEPFIVTLKELINIVNGVHNK